MPHSSASDTRAARVIVLEAPRGRSRAARLAEWTDRVRRAERAGWLLPCDVELGGLWTGLDRWIEALLPELDERAPDLATRHDQELFAVLPTLRRTRTLRHQTLTDEAEGDESVRNYAADRANRIGHGIVDLLEAWHERSGGGRWAVACDDFDRSGVLVGRFFRELLRRRGGALGLTMLVAVEPGAGERVAAELSEHAHVRRVRMDLPADAAPPLEPAEAARRAAELKARAERDRLGAAEHVAELIRLWEAAGDEVEALNCRATAVSMLNHQGFYEDALPHARAIHAALPRTADRTLYYATWPTISNVHIAYVASGDPETARDLLVAEAVEKLPAGKDRALAYYSLGMLHARFLPDRDLEVGERHLRDGLADAEAADVPPEERHFLVGFLLNGLAYIRFRQGAVEEAAELSHTNSRRLDEHLPVERHRLHRSVLLYNAGQVYARTGDDEAAIRCFTEAMEMDPGYSEYYNDRGNLLLKLGRLDEAERDYLQAIELSPPYPEVWFNLGQCYSRMQRPEDAERAYARAVDLDPARHKAWVNLARTRLSFGRRDEALAAYDAAIAADGTNPFVLANRAALRLDLGRTNEALDDLERAVALAPDHPTLLRNRALVREAIGRRAMAVG